ncbi:hypothetical protein [Citreimonas salinaria]|uniref:SH3 domain-containing protein n=1 Tax=Citreimonas salinaria TaxID=321339 RepID=A0A1H3LC58_9RHOB|nr:hypothetical protein [Citreimonas salinaria]SDY61759.1 hypothetical protein SAMN05444340_11258 [Citreimonas salinaria]
MLQTKRAALLCAAMVAAPNPAPAEADGPDAWRVSGVASDDVLNMRMGPGTEYPVIGALAHDARHLRAETCAPLATFAQLGALSASERAALPARWCLMDAGSRGRGWVAQAYLAEDSLPAGQAARPPVDKAPPPFDIAVPLVRNLFQKEAFLLGRGESVLDDSEESRAWFALALARRMAADPGAYLLFDAQDVDLGDVTVTHDPANPVRQGLVTILVRFANFGTPREARVLVRADPEQAGAMRIIAVEHESGAAIR